MNIDGWRYYNHAAIPTCAPHEVPNTAPIDDGSIWKMGGGTPLFARWTEQFDCGYETNWWYIIKDSPFDLSLLNAKRRYEINKGLKHFEVHEFNFQENKQSVANIYEAAIESYKFKYAINKNDFIKNNKEQESTGRYYGAFEKESGKMCAFCYLRYQDHCAHYILHKSIPSYEKYGVNAALVAGMLESNSEFLHKGYICDGARSINHETAFQDYLEKYFGFRKAYCMIKVKYCKKMRIAVSVLFPFRRILEKNKTNGFIHNINAILKMEQIVRQEI